MTRRNSNDKVHKKRYTMRDISEIAGVSSSTVSLVINNKKGVSEKVRIRIKAIIEKLNYVPSALARALVLNKTNVIGLIVSSISDPFYAELARGVEDSGFKKGYSLLVCNSDLDVTKESLYISLMVEQHVSGFVIVPVSDEQSSIDLALNTGVPVVVADRRADPLKVSSVVSNNLVGAYDLTKYLLKLGHKRIACVRNFPFVSTVRDRLEGYRKALTDSGIPVDEKNIVTAENIATDAQEITERFLGLRPRPSAIMTNNDVLALEIGDVLLKKNIKIPEDISLAGFDNIKFAELARVPLTTVEQPKYEMGTIAFGLLLDRINGCANRSMLLDTRLVIRASTGICPKMEPSTSERLADLTK